MKNCLTMVLRTATLASVATALAVAAQAQPAGAPQQGPPGHPPMAEMKAMHEAVMKQRMADMKTILRLRADQEAALTAFMGAHHPDRRGMGGPKGMGEGPKTTPERLDDMAQREAAMAAAHAKRREALGKFYAALDPEQRKVFDALQRLQGGGRGDHGMKRAMRRGGPGGHPPMRGAPN